MGICSSVDVQKSPLHHDGGGGGGKGSRQQQQQHRNSLYAVNPQQGGVGNTQQQQQGEGNHYDSVPSHHTHNNEPHEPGAYRPSSAQAQAQKNDYGRHHGGQQGGNEYGAAAAQGQAQLAQAHLYGSASPHHGNLQHHSSQHQSAAHRYQSTTPVHTSPDAAYHAHHGHDRYQSRHRSQSGERHRAITEYRDEYHRSGSPRHQTSHQHGSSHHGHSHHIDGDISPRSSRSSRLGGSSQRKNFVLVPVTVENLAQHTRTFNTPKIHTVQDIIAEALAEDKAALRDGYAPEAEMPYDFSAAGTMPFTQNKIVTKNDHGMGGSQHKSNRRRARTGASTPTPSAQSVSQQSAGGGSNGDYAFDGAGESFSQATGRELSHMSVSGMHTPSQSRTRIRLLSQGSVQTVQTVQSGRNGPIPAHAKLTGPDGRLAAPGFGQNGGTHHSYHQSSQLAAHHLARSATDVPSINESVPANHSHTPYQQAQGRMSPHSHDYHRQQQASSPHAHSPHAQMHGRSLSHAHAQQGGMGGLSPILATNASRTGTPQPMTTAQNGVQSSLAHAQTVNRNTTPQIEGEGEQLAAQGDPQQLQQPQQNLLPQPAASPLTAMTPNSGYATHGGNSPGPQSDDYVDRNSRHPYGQNGVEQPLNNGQW